MTITAGNSNNGIPMGGYVPGTGSSGGGGVSGDVYRYKGSVPTYTALPAENLETGDVYNVIDTDMNYAWTGTAWDPLGSTVDLSPYYTGAQVEAKLLQKQNVFTTQKPIYLDKKQDSDKVGWGYEDPYLVPQNQINLTGGVSPTYIQYAADSTKKMPSNYMLFPLYEQDADPASAIIKVPISKSNNNYEKLFFGKYVDGYFVPLCYFTYQSFSGNSVSCKPYAIGGVNYTNPIVTSTSTSGTSSFVTTINIEGNAIFQRSTRDLQVQGGWGQQSHSSVTSQPLDDLFQYYWPYSGNMYGMAINLQRNTENGTVTGIGCTYTNGTITYMIVSGDTDLCELLSEATFALYCFDVSTPAPTNNKDHRLFGYYKYSDTGAVVMPWLLTGQNIDEFWTNVLQHNSFTTGAEILESNQLRLGVDNNTIKVNSSGQLYSTVTVPANITTQGNTFNGASQLVQLDSTGKLPAIDGSQLTNLPGGSYTLPAATTSALGGVKPDGTTITVDEDGTIHSTQEGFADLATNNVFTGTNQFQSTVTVGNGFNTAVLNMGPGSGLIFENSSQAGGKKLSLGTQTGTQVTIYSDGVPIIQRSETRTNQSSSEDNPYTKYDNVDSGNINDILGISFWKGTQTEYDGITEKDANTLYIITG